MRSLPQGRAGFTLVEVVIVLVVIGLATMIAVPRFRASPKTKARMSATRLAADIELARTQAMARRAAVLVVFNTADNSYTGYLDFDRELPGRVHRVTYERMVDDTEAEVRRLLDYCGLPFEPGCLRFFENERPVRTASSEQVRRPIYREGLDQWRHYEPWLGPLATTLGDVLGAYPAVPESMEEPKT